MGLFLCLLNALTSGAVSFGIPKDLYVTCFKKFSAIYFKK
jgi:hypothetical protein